MVGKSFFLRACYSEIGVGGRVIDGYGQPPIENGTVLIKGQRIVAVGALGSKRVRWIGALSVLPRLVTHPTESFGMRFTDPDGVTLVLRDNGRCHYVEEDAIGPLWKGQRFPLESCISGWVMTTSSSCGVVGARQWAGEGWQLARTRSGSGLVVIRTGGAVRDLSKASRGPIETFGRSNPRDS